MLLNGTIYFNSLIGTCVLMVSRNFLNDSGFSVSIVVSVQAFIEREQLREELENMRGRFEEHVAQMQKIISDECELARREGQAVRDQLETRV
jgi:hypothetical protein